MKLFDTSCLVYVANASHPHHPAARAAFDSAMSVDEVLLPWNSILGFLRLSTSRVAMPVPIPIDEALAEVDRWLARGNVRVPVPGPDHFTRVRRLLEAAHGGGALGTDAHLAALALQYGAIVVSFDADFARFPGVRWERPAA